jgi:hypothetical protein
VTPYLEVIAREWASRAEELATWTYQHMINRTDVWGSYLPMAKRHKQSFFIAPFKDARGKEFLTKSLLARHFAGLDGHLISLHSTSADRTSRWITIDIDRHDRDEDSTKEGNFAAALAWFEKLGQMGFDPLLTDTNGTGGYHVLILLDAPIPTADIIAFGRSVIADWAGRGLPREPETYPGHVPSREDHHGDCLRLPGRHHTREFFTKVWSGDPELPDSWLEGSAAIDRILQVKPAPASLVPRGLPQETKVTKKATRRERPKVCVDLDGVLAEYNGWQGIDFTGPPLPGAVEFTRKISEFADVVVFTMRCSAEPNRIELGEPSRPAFDLAPRLMQKVQYWLDKHGFEYAEIYIGQGKPSAHAFIDDRSVPCHPQKDPQAFATALKHAKALCSARPAPEGAPAKADLDPRLDAIIGAWDSLPDSLREELAQRARNAERRTKSE